MKENRIMILDIIRGLCITLMILDHIFYIGYHFACLVWNDSVVSLLKGFCNLSFFWIAETSIRFYAHQAVLIVFFLVAGYSSMLSKNPFKRFVKLLVIATLITAISMIITKTINYDVVILFGVFHCYALCQCCSIFIRKLKNFKSVYILTTISILISILLLVFKPTINNSNILVWLGIPKDNFVYAIEYFPLFPWISVYLIGYILARHTLDKLKFTKSKKIFSPIAFIGRNGIYIYIGHIALIVSLFYSFNQII